MNKNGYLLTQEEAAKIASVAYTLHAGETTGEYLVYEKPGDEDNTFTIVEIKRGERSDHYTITVTDRHDDSTDIDFQYCGRNTLELMGALQDIAKASAEAENRKPSLADREKALEDELFVVIVQQTIMQEDKKGETAAQKDARDLLSKFRSCIQESDDGTYLMVQEAASAICDLIGSDEDAFGDLMNADYAEFIEMIEEQAETSFENAIEAKEARLLARQSK